MLKVRQAQASLRARTLLATVAAALSVVWGAALTQQSPPPPSKLPLPKVDPPAKRIITQGPAKIVTEDLIPCANPKPGMNLRKNPVGKITTQVGTQITVPVAKRYDSRGTSDPSLG